MLITTSVGTALSIFTSMGRNYTYNKSPEEYRRLADKCRETARGLRAKRAEPPAGEAQVWDLMTDRVGRTRGPSSLRCRSALSAKDRMQNDDSENSR